MSSNHAGIRRAYEQTQVNQGALDTDNPQYAWLRAEVAALGEADRVLDAGAGNGRYANALWRDYDLSVDAFDLVGRSASLDKSVRYFQAGIEAIPLQTSCFTLVYSFSTLHYLDETDTGLREFYRVLRPGGRLVFSVHTRWSLFSLLRAVRRWLDLPGTSHLRGVHFHSAGHYIEALERAGFAVERVDGWRLSFLMVPLWRRLACWLNTHGVSARGPGPMRFAHTRWWARLRSEFAYHAIFTARKPEQTQA